MADGELTLKLDDETQRRLKAAADAAGVSVDAYAAELIADGLDGDWTEALRRLEEYDRTGEYITLEDGLAFLHDELEKRLADKG